MLVRAVAGLPRAYCFSRCERILLSQARWPAFFPTTHPSGRNCEAGIPLQTSRHASTSSSTRWKSRQSRDHYAADAKLSGLKSRAAFKLLEINAKHRLFARGDTVIDLGYAPGSWSQVAISKTAPGGRVVGIDVIPAQPPRGVSTIQGDFLSAEVREEVRRFVQEPMRGRVRERAQLSRNEDEAGVGVTEDQLEEENKGLMQRAASEILDVGPQRSEGVNAKQLDKAEGRVVNVVLSDMSEPWPLTSSTWIKSVSNPYRRMLNTSGNAARDHGGSMDLCNAALMFCYDTLVTGGHFVCKFYQGAEDQALERSLKALFEKVHRIKPDSSRKESRESYFVCLRRRAGVHRDTVFDDEG